jgi:hypothetical protein
VNGGTLLYQALMDNLIKGFLESTEFKAQPKICPANTPDRLVEVFDADTALMSHDQSFAFFVRIPYLWFDQSPSQLPIRQRRRSRYCLNINRRW